jgi:signal transduction histidine kinase
MNEVEKKHLLLEYKPFGAEPLAEYLIGLEKNETVLPESSDVLSKQSTRTIRQQSFLGYIDADVQTLIREIVSKTKADGGALFHESASKKGEIDWLVLEGININDPEAHTLLYYSPVEDVIRDQEDLLIDNVYENQAQSKYLMRIVPFVSCVGLKITVPFESRGAALFLFSQDAQAFSRQVLDDSDRLALENLLYRQMIFRTLLSTQDEVLRSQLRAGALHDVNNSLGSMDFKLSRLAERLRELEDGFSRETLAQAGLIANEIQSDAAQMRRTLELFRKLGRSNISEEADVNSIVRRAVEHQKALASHLNVDLTLTADSGIPGSNLNSSFVQQSMENVILNAIQWSAGHHTHRVEVHTSFDVNDTLLPIKVRVSDTGPGIHQQLHKEKIFELGYSTREKGSGLGLFIAKALVVAMGGKIDVEQSVMEIGTTMGVSLPNSTTEA